MHLSTLSALAADIGYLPASSTYGRLRTALINLTMKFCGSRLGRGWFRPGELRYGISASQSEMARSVLKKVQKES